MINKCSSGMNALLKYEADIFSKGILQDSTDGWTLFDLEQTLLTLGSHKNLTKGVFYCLALPATEGSPTIVR